MTLAPARIEELKAAHEANCLSWVPGAKEFLAVMTHADRGELLVAASENERLRELLTEVRPLAGNGHDSCSPDICRWAALATRIDRALASPTTKAGE